MPIHTACTASKSRRLLLTGTAIALVLGAINSRPAYAVCNTVGNVTTCTGDVSAGVPDLFNPVDTLVIENTTTVLGGRSIFMNTSNSDVTVNADFAPQDLVNDATGFGLTERTGVHIQAFSGSANISLNGDMTIQAGPDELGMNSLLTDRDAGIFLASENALTVFQTGDVVVTAGSQTVTSDGVAATDTELFAGMAVISEPPMGVLGDINLARAGDLTVNGPIMTATSNDAVGSNRVIVNNVSGVESKGLYGLLGLGSGDITVNNTGDITLNIGELTGITTSAGGRAESVGSGFFAMGLGLPAAPNTPFAIGPGAGETPRSDTVIIRNTGNIEVNTGDRTFTAVSGTNIGDPASEAVVQIGTGFLDIDSATGVRVTTALNLDAEFNGNITVNGGMTNVTANALAGPDTMNGNVSASAFGTDAQGAFFRGDSIFTENDTDNDGLANVVFNGAVSATGGSVNADIAGTGLALRPVSGFPPPADGPLGEINIAGGDATGITIERYVDETTISANPVTMGRSIERVDQMEVTLGGPITMQGGSVEVAINGADLPGRFNGGRALGLSSGFDGITLNTAPGANIVATGGHVDVDLTGSHGVQRAAGGRATGAFVNLQSNTDVTFDPDVTSTGGNAVLTGDGGTEANMTTMQEEMSFVSGGQAVALNIGHRTEYFNSELENLSQAQQGELDARKLFVTGTITATGGDGMANDADVVAIGGEAVGIQVEFDTDLVLQGDVIATGGTGTNRDGQVVGVEFDRFGAFNPGIGEFFPGLIRSIRIEGSVMATGQGFDAGDLVRNPFDPFFGGDFTVDRNLAAGVRAISGGRTEVSVANGGTVSTQGDYVHGILAAGENTHVTIESGGSVLAQGMNANAIEVRPFQDISFATNDTAQAANVSIMIEDGGVVTSVQGTGIKDDDRRVTVDLFQSTLPRFVETFANQTEVHLAGTVNGGNGTAIDLGGGADTVILRSTAVVNGNTQMGDGDDEMVVFGGAQINGGIEFGDGMDLLAFDGGAGTVSNISLFANGATFATGFELLEKRGEGTWIFGGDDLPALTPVATGRIIEGTSVVNANFVTVDVSTEVAGRLEGNGGVRSLSNSGVFAPGGAGAVSTFQIANNLTFNPAGTFHVDILAPNEADLVQVGGTTTLGGTLGVNAIGLTSDYAIGQEFTVIESGGAVTGDFATINDNLPDLDVVVGVNPAIMGELVVLGLAPEPVPVIDPDPTPGSDPVTPDPDPITQGPEDPNPGPMPPVTPAPPAPNLSDKSVHPNALQGAAHAGQQLAGLLQSRSGGVGTPGAQGDAVSRFRARSPAPGTGAHYTWGSAFGAIRDVDGSPTITAYDATTAGLAGGYEYVMDAEGARTVLGFGISYAQTNMDSGPSSAEIDTYSIGVYGSYEQDNWRLSGALSYGLQDYDIDRVIPVGAGFAVANGSADGSAFAVSAKLAYDVAPSLGIAAQNATRLAPYVQLDHVSVDRDGFTETGAGVLNLAVASDSFSQSTISLGVETSMEIQNPNGTVTMPYFDIHWEHVLDGRSSVSNSFIAGTPAASFASAGAFEERNRIGLGAGVRIDMSNDSSLDMRYSGAFADGYTDHSASVEFRMNF